MILSHSHNGQSIADFSTSPHYYVAADYARFEFTSPHKPPRRIPVSETGYKSHFSPMHEVESAPCLEEYAHAVILELMSVKSGADEEDEDEQLDLF